MQPHLQHTYEKIEAYLTKRLNDVERQALEQSIAEDPGLRETVVKMQLLRKITERNLTRLKVMSIHAAKTNEWKKLTMDDSELENKAETLAQNLVTENSEETTNITEEVYEEATPSRSWLPAFLWSICVLLALTAVGFAYLAKTPVVIRENKNLLAATSQAADSTQQVYVKIYQDGLQALQSGNNLAAISYFETALSSQKLPKYHADAAQFLESVAYAEQQPNEAAKKLDAIIKEPTFGYPYTNKDKLQVQCKILWARLMGWNN